MVEIDPSKQPMKGGSCESVNSESLFALEHEIACNDENVPKSHLGRNPESYSGYVTGPNDRANEMSGQPSGVQTGECVKEPSSGARPGECVKKPPPGVRKKGGEQQGCRLRLPERKTPSLDEERYGSCDVKGKTLCEGLRDGHPDVKGESMWNGLPDEGMIFDAAACDGVQPFLPISSNAPGDGSTPMRRAIFIELCAGSAKLSAACATKGMTALSIDHSSNRHRTRHHVKTLDLSDAQSWEILRDVCRNHQVIWVHIAPPCGTASRARERQLSTMHHGPKPLRSPKFPEGLPWLGPADRARVDAANCIYNSCASFCEWLTGQGIAWSVENPGRSYMWEMPSFVSLRAISTFVDFDSCMHGGMRAKHTSFLCGSEELLSLAVRCDGQHEHLEWGLLPDGTFSTATEAEYPDVLCSRIAELVSALAMRKGFKAPTSLEDVGPLQLNSMAMQMQPIKSTPPFLSEFERVVEVQVQDMEPTLDSKGKLTAPFHQAPVGAKRLKTVRKQVGDCMVTVMLFGVYRTPCQFVSEVLRSPHPFDVFCDVPDCMLRLMFFMLTEGPVNLAKFRLAKISQWRMWLEQLETEESKLHDMMDSQIAMVLKPKRLLLLKRIAEELDWPDRDLVGDIAEGFKLVGTPKVTGVFQTEPAVPKITVQQLDDLSPFIGRQLWDRIGQAKSDSEVWDITLQESTDKGWLSEAMSFDQLDERFSGLWTPVRRFGIQQSGKTRVIDDFSENGCNSAYAAQEKVDLRALDHISWCGAALSSMALRRGEARFRLSDGELLVGQVHQGWRNKGESLVSKTVDLKSAYKQLAIHPSDRKRSVISVKDPKDSQVYGFISRTLPFGAASAVLSFNRVARLLWRILVSAGILCTNYFDDYPVLDFSSTSDTSVHAIRSIMSMLGFKCSLDKEVEFTEKTDLLGVTLDTTMASKGTILISNKESRVKALSENIDAVIRAGVLKGSEVPKLFGRLQFAEHQVVGRVGKIALAELRSLEDNRCEQWRLDEAAVKELELLKYRLCSHPPRSLNFDDTKDTVFVFTDGACEPGADGSYVASVGGVIIGKSVKQYFGGTLDGSLVQRWMNGKKHIIGLVELYAVVLARAHWDSYFKGCRVIFFIDNMAAMRALIKGYSSDKQWRDVLRRFEEYEMSQATYPWFARVPSDSNIADGPSRDDVTGLEEYDHSIPVCLYSHSMIQW